MELYLAKFVPIIGFEEYLINPDGIIMGKRFKKPLSIVIHRDGYAKCSLYKNNKRYWFQLQRLVAISFIPNLLNLPQVNHIDGNKLNNNVLNLEWCTASENVLHSFRVLNKNPNKTTCLKVQAKSKNEILLFDCITDASKLTGISYNYLAKRLRQGYDKEIKGYKWHYAGDE